jgi:hypothetical protein
MNGYKCLALATVAGICLMAGTAKTQAQISVNIGAEPSCPYGYYDYAPYNCAPTGYYGPEWFNGASFIGAGPWFHGPSNFHGSVNNHLDQQHGYHGSVPNRGDKAEVANRPSKFKGNESRDGRGNVVKGK